MSTLSLPAPASAGADALAPFAPLRVRGRSWTVWLGPLLSLMLLGAAFAQVGAFDFGALYQLLPRSPWFWLLFVVTYSATPLFDWIIFRRLWSIPAAGLVALFRKRLSNELLFGYVGDLSFYAWARNNVAMAGSPFGAVKDSAILSGMMGNVVTLAMAILTLPVLATFHLAIGGWTFATSLAVLAAVSVVPLVFRRRLFSLPAADRRMVAGIHLARIIVNLILYAALWHLMLPGVGLSWWVMLSTVRMALSRLPFVPNKDALFAAAAVFLIGQEGQIVEVLALMASLLFAAHLVVGLLLGATGLREGHRMSSVPARNG